MRSRAKKLFAVFAALFTIMLLSDMGNAQPRRARGKFYTKAEVNQVIKRIETRVDNFVVNYDRSLDRSRLNGTNREDWLNKRARDLEKATDELDREFTRRDAWIENKDEVRRCLNIATDINKNMKSRRYGAGTEANWSKVVYELNTLARIYNLPLVGSPAY